MAKPWFKFNVSKWNDGEISLEKYHIRGMFIAVCSYFWSRECTLTRVGLTKKFGKKVVENLSELQYISFDGDKLRIPFLEEEWAESSKNSQISAKNGKNGGRPKTQQEPDRFSEKTQLREDKIREDKIREDKIREDKRREEPSLPFGERFAKSWGEWVQFRKEKREPLRPTTIKKQLEMLGRFSEDEAIYLIDYSITSGYTGLFPEQLQKKSGFGKGSLPDHL